MAKKENNRKNFSGYKKWCEEKERRNRTKHQVYIYTRGTVENPIMDPHWEHLNGPNPLKGTPNAKTQAS